MGKTSLPLAVTTKEGRLRSSCQCKGDHHSEDKFVTLVIRPLLACLWVVGFPVPILCTHGESIQNNYHESSRGSGCSKIGSEEDSAEPGKEKSPRNSSQLTGNEEVEVLEDVMNITQFESSPRDRGVFAKKSKTTMTHSQNQPTVSCSSHTIRPFHYNEISEENPTKTAQRFMSQKTKLRSTHLPTGIQERGGNGNMKPQDVQKRFQCKRCRIKQILGRLIIFGTHTLLCVLNLGRYMTIFFDVTALDGSVVFSIMFTLFFLSVVYIYVTTFYSMSKHMTPLVRLLQVYNKLYSININCESFFKHLKRVVATSVVIQMVMGMAVVSGFHTFFPTFRKHLTPFSHLSGVSLYVVSLFFGIVLCINISIISVLFAFLRVVSIMIQRGFCTVNKHLKALFCSRKDSILELPNQGIDDMLRDAQESTLRQTHKLPQAKNSDFGHYQTNQTDSDKRTLSHNPARIGASSIPRENPEAEELTPGQGEQIHCIRKEGVHHCLRHQSHSTSNTSPHHQQGNNNQSENVSSNTHTKNETVHSDPGRGSTEHDDVVEDVIGLNDRFLNVAGDDDVDNPSGQTRSASGRNLQEHSFDCLHSQHQVLCAIVQHLQGCVAHLLSTTFISGLPQFCMVIYGLGSSSLGTDEALFMAFMVLEMIVAIVTCFLIGIVVRDTAHEPQDIIYEADWSKLSDTLLPKVQLFSSQLANTQIGFHVYGLFAIDRSAVLTVVGTLVTYSIVVVQFQQGSTANCTTIHNSTATP